MLGSAINQVGHPCARLWSGLAAVVRCARTPRPPPTCPTMTIEVGMVFVVAAPVGVNERLFVRLIVKLVAVPAAATGTVMITGDHVGGVGGVVTGADAGFNGAHVAVDPVTAVPQK